MAEHLACILFLGFLAIALLVILFFFANLRDLRQIPRNYSFGHRVAASLGTAIHQVTINNNGWFLVFTTMWLLSWMIWVKVQFDKPSLYEQVKLETTGEYERNLGIQKLGHWLMDGQWRQSTPQELGHDEAAWIKYRRQMDHWPWFACGIIMMGIAVASIPIVLRDEVGRVWERIRRIHFQGRSENIALSENFFASMLDRLTRSQQAQAQLQSTPAGTVQTPQPAPQPSTTQQTGFRFGSFLLAEFVWELIEEVFRSVWRSANRA